VLEEEKPKEREISSNQMEKEARCPEVHVFMQCIGKMTEKRKAPLPQQSSAAEAARPSKQRGAKKYAKSTQQTKEDIYIVWKSFTRARSGNSPITAALTPAPSPKQYALQFSEGGIRISDLGSPFDKFDSLGRFVVGCQGQGGTQ
jgi:hypothetical protein